MERFEGFNKSFIDGKWTEGKTGQTFDNKNPYDQSVINTFSLASLDQLKGAFETAKEAQKSWGQTTPEERREILQKVAEYLENNRESIVDIISRETGGSNLKANVELDLTLQYLVASFDLVDKVNAGREVTASPEGKKNYVYRLPLGVITSISPFNFPMNLSMRTIAPALALGNTVVHKPDVQTGLSGGSIIARAFEMAGLPKSVLQVIQADVKELGDEMFTTPHSGLVSFTGSTAVGKHIGEVAGKLLKRVALELGGNNPFIVLSDADVDRAIDAAIFGKFIHQGQICMIINRFIIHKDKYDEFVQKFINRAKQVPYGDPKDPKTIIGPLINERQADKAMQFIEQAKDDGIKLALEGQRIGNLITPYVFVDVDNRSKLAQTEMFAPICTMIKAESDEQAIEIANDTEYGLSSAIFTSDLEKGRELALQVESGMTHVNDQTVNDSPTVPFGGTKASGVGRFGNEWIVDEFTVTKWVSLQTEYRKYPF
ncbi:aldehyde dehydrogenase family protein [Neobacillus sp. SAB-20_R2A]|uniref:aldehyde dehydrogenase family protein n=1 Tax=Neobacillus sp. SAB-20_R2A TaxID=3120519 RepID=UPI003C6E97DE